MKRAELAKLLGQRATPNVRESPAPRQAVIHPVVVDEALERGALTIDLPLPPSWNRVFKARAIPLGKGKWTAQVYKSADAKEYAAKVAFHCRANNVRPFPAGVMLRFSGVVAMERAGLVVVGGVEHVITDIGMRMLQPHELLRAQFGRFAEGYDLSAAKTSSAQVRLIGNSVCPELAEAVVRANAIGAKARAA